MVQRVDKDSLKLDQPRRTPGHPTKSHIVKTKIDGKETILRFGEQGAETAGKPKEGESERMKDKRASFKSRHAKNIAKGKSSPAYWANKVKWAEGGPVAGMAVGGGWGQMAAAGPVGGSAKAAADREKAKESLAQAAASMSSSYGAGAASAADRDDRAPAGTYSGTGVGKFSVVDLGDPEMGIGPTVRYDQGPSVRDLAQAYGVDDGGISPEMRAYLSSPINTVAESTFPMPAPSVITMTPLGDNVAPVSQPSQPAQPAGFFGQLMALPGAIGRDLKMGYQAGLFRGRDTQRENLMEAGYTPAQINDYFARTDATLARNAAEAAMRGDRDDFGMQPATNYEDLARGFAQEYNIVGRNRAQLMPLLEAFLRGRGILDPSTYSENIFNTLSIPMQRGGSVDLHEMYRRYADGGAVLSPDDPFYVPPEPSISPGTADEIRARALANRQRMAGEDTFGDTAAAMAAGPWQEAARRMSIAGSREGVAGLFPEAQNPYLRALQSAQGYIGDVGLAGLSAAEAGAAGLGGLIAEAAPQGLIERLPGAVRRSPADFERKLAEELVYGIPESMAGMAGGRALTALDDAIESARMVPTGAMMDLDRMLEAYDPNVLGSNLGNVGGRRPPRGPGGGEPPEVPPEATSVAPRASVVGSSVAYRSPTEQREQARQQIQALVDARAPDDPKRRVKIEDIAAFHQQNHLAQHGRQLDPFNAEDFDLAARAAEDEVRYQLGQAVSGKGWYDSDVQKTFEIASGIPGLEDLATSEADRVIMSAIMAPTSIGQVVSGNTRAAIAAMRHYKRTGQVPTEPPAPGTVTEGIQNAGWGLKQQSAAAGMRVINHLLNKFGPEKFADWWLSPHTLKELKDLRKEAGFSGDNPSGLSGGDKSMHLGAMILGDKTGRFSLNINGYEGTTKDVWFSRSYNRYFGNMFDNKGEVVGGPRNATERRRMEEFTRNLRTRLEDQGLSEQDIQAILWYYEQNLMTDLGVMSRPGAFSEEAERLYGNLRPAVRAGDEAEAAAEPRSLEGFRGISPTQRAVRAERRLPGRLDAGDPSGAAGPYERAIGQGDEGDGLLVLTPRADSLTRYQAAGLNVPTIREVPAQQSAAQYNADMTEAMKGHEFGAQVEIKSPEDLAQARLFRTEDGSGFAIKPDGDIVAVFAGKGSAKGSAYSMLQAAVAAGGRKLDAFDTYLPKIYETAGFRPVARLPWNDEFAPPDWDKKTFADYNGGEPDVVFFVYDPNYFGGAKNVPVFDDYGDAVAEQERVLQSMMAPAPAQRARGGSISIEDLAGKYDIGGRGYARGGTVRAQPKGYAAGGLVTPFDPAMIDQIVNRVKGAARV